METMIAGAKGRQPLLIERRKPTLEKFACLEIRQARLLCSWLALMFLIIIVLKKELGLWWGKGWKYPALRLPRLGGRWL
jgi:hypothetical protein